MSDLLQILNLILTGGVLIAALKLAFHHGQVTQKVEDHEKRITRVEDRVFGDER